MEEELTFEEILWLLKILDDMEKERNKKITITTEEEVLTRILLALENAEENWRSRNDKIAEEYHKAHLALLDAKEGKV